MSLARNIATVGTATLLSRLLGFLRDIGIAAVIGTGVSSDAFFAMWQVPNLFRRLLAEGALNAAFIPMWLRIREQSGDHSARRFSEEVLGTLALTLGLIALGCIIFAPAIVQVLVPGFRSGGERLPLAVFYLRLCAAYVLVAGVAAAAAARLNAEGRVTAAAFGLLTFNLVMIAAVIVILSRGYDAAADAGTMLSAAIVVAGLCQLAVIGAGLARLSAPPRLPRFSWSADMHRFWALMLPGVIVAGIPPLKLMAGTVVASSAEQAVSWLYYANRLYELPLGLVSVAVSAVMVPLIAASVRSGRLEAIAAAQSRALEMTVGLALPAAVGLALLAEPIAGGLFQRGAFGPSDTAAVAAALAAIAIGLPGQALERVFGAICFAREDTRTPMYAGLAGLMVAGLGAVALFPHYGHVGVAGAIALSGWAGAGVLAPLLVWRRWLAVDRAAGRRLPRILAAVVVMGLAIAGADALIAARVGTAASGSGRIVVLAVLVTVGLAVYLALLAHLNVARPRDIAAAIRSRR